MKSKFIAMAAAVVASASAAQAADLGHPVKVAVDYVKVCDAYGAGFFYIPGSDTCLQIGGYVRAQYITGSGNIFAVNGTTGYIAGPYRYGRRDVADYQTTLRSHLTFDARTNTEYGLLRSFIATRVNYNGGTTAAGTAAVDLDKGYIQWGGLTAGRAESFYAYYFGTTYQTNFSEVFADFTTNLLAYTFAFGNGVSATLSLEDAYLGQNKSGTTGPIATNGTAFTYGANHVPDVVANLNVTQAWGSAQLSLGLHEDYSNNTAVGSKWGWGVLGGVTINLPTLGAGDAFGIQAAYSVGALKYVHQGAFQGPSVFANIGADAILDNTGTSIKQTKAWAIGAGFKHNFSPMVEWDINGGVYGVDGYLANDYTGYEIGSTLRWKPVKGLELGANVEYRNLNFTSATKAAYTTTTTSLRNADAFVFGLRVQRSF